MTPSKWLASAFVFDSAGALNWIAGSFGIAAALISAGIHFYQVL